jgi:hypothetical protein
MPRPPRRSKSRRAGYDDQHISHLLYGVYLCPGHGFATEPPGFNKDCTDWPAFREAWEELRHQLLPEFIAEHPGERPYAWWKCDARERRQRTDGIQHPFDNRVRKSHVDEVAKRFPSFHDEAYKLNKGRPNCLCVRDDFEAQYESEEAYLRRLNLLTPEEVEALAK